MSSQGLWHKVYDVEARLDPEGARKIKAGLRAAVSDITTARNLPESEGKQAIWMELDTARTAVKNLIQMLPVDEELSTQDADALFPRHPNPDSLKVAAANAFITLTHVINFAKANNWDEIAEELEGDPSSHLTLVLILSGAIKKEDDILNYIER